MRTFQGRKALVTGAASGIGRAIALRLAREGMQLLLVDIDGRALAEVCNEALGMTEICLPHVCDLSNREAVHALADRVLNEWNGVDLLVNNAGIVFYGPTHTMTESQWDKLLDLNLMAPIRLTQRLLPSLLQRDDAHIVNMCSITGLVPGGRFCAYGTSKYGLVGFTESLRAEYGRKGLGVTAICPGPSLTKLYEAGDCGHKNSIPRPPAWLCATPERIADVTLSAIRWNKRKQLVTPMAHMVYQIDRFFPWLMDLVNTFSRRNLPWYLGGRRKPKSSSNGHSPAAAAR
ncbi:MAG: SDR family oxidoreductase [Planctomycetaceae bacterium]|nr:SDR family oxidoreductase [Planctomycetaceae bacterium]MCB9950302.1 SDR family oxidoreductase [Planctomycetaceae bacterium]